MRRDPRHLEIRVAIGQSDQHVTLRQQAQRGQGIGIELDAAALAHERGHAAGASAGSTGGAELFGQCRNAQAGEIVGDLGPPGGQFEAQGA